ncbi:MAG: LysM peptidoglycan-binding domain-containing protein, partial [Thermoguttaceae bacterium]|nr:LysM peptidoglycan-binding domain-containing protein [Thermoguttaceae bacterium]
MLTPGRSPGKEVRKSDFRRFSPLLLMYYIRSQKFNTTIGALKAINKLNGNILQPGQILQLPNFVT